MTIESQMTQDMNVNGTVMLSYLSGDPIGLLERITCDWLILEEQKIETMSFLEEMLQTRVRVLSFLSYPDAFDCSVLTNYDGKGKYEWIRFRDCELISINILKSWVYSKGWTVSQEDYLQELDIYCLTIQRTMNTLDGNII